MSNDANTPDAENDAVADGESDAPQGERTIEALEAELATVRDQMLRAAAEAENTRKRAEREVADARAYSVTGFARDVLSVGDNLSRALDALSPELRENMGEAGRTLLSGIELTQKELVAALSRNGVSPINVEPGAAFDPNLHQAAAQIPSSHPSGTVVEVIQSGWMIGERVLRAAVVAVSAGGGSPSEAAPETSEPGGSVDTTA
ncbi:MAG: nucleotide exchange factor GrpE [Maricaulaceae bacterium]|jgi:molecular chaperone GrpE